jgi:hypothetical protein
MQFSDEVKKQIVEGFIDIFTRISSKEFQKRIWIKGEGPEEDGYDDTVCDFFLGCDSIIENYKDFGITESQCNLLSKFRDLFDKFVVESRHYLPEEFIDTPEWGEITDMAKEVLEAFNYPKKLG